jgi:hypothetical protein
MKRFFVTVLTLMSLGGATFVGYIYGKNGNGVCTAPASPSGVVVDAQLLKAGGLAYEAFLHSLANQESPDKEFEAFIRSASNYRVVLSGDSKFYIFTFSPEPYERGVVKGAVVFKVDRSSYGVDAEIRK